MSSQGTRVNLTLSDEVVAILDRIGAVTGAGRSTIVRELLESGLSNLSEMARALELAQGRNIDAFKVIADALRETGSEVEQLQLEVSRKRRAAMRKRKRD